MEWCEGTHYDKVVGQLSWMGWDGMGWDGTGRDGMFCAVHARFGSGVRSISRLCDAM